MFHISQKKFTFATANNYITTIKERKHEKD